MSDAWRIVVVEADEALNQNVVNALRKDGYVVQGVLNGADAVRILWSEACDVVVCDAQTPGPDGFELLQWLRAYRPHIRMIMVGVADAPALRLQALESGAESYVEKPLDLRVLKEELRRLLQQTGFTASLDSFDLLDVIQIITMSRKSITLLINTGLEERGTLRFQNGELIWADYGILRGEEAFFALAAHKNGTVTQHLWDEQEVVNVKQPLSRLIFQALQYRTKYADRHQLTGEQAAVRPVALEQLSPLDIDDRPFVFASEVETDPVLLHEPDAVYEALPVPHLETVGGPERENREWWERTGEIASVSNMLNGAADASAAPTMAIAFPQEAEQVAPPLEPAAVANGSSVELPSWLTEQPTASNLPLVRPQVPITPIIPNNERGAPTPVLRTTEEFSPAPPISVESQREGKQSASIDVADVLGQSDVHLPSSFEMPQENSPALSSGPLTAQRTVARRNYAALVSALQTLGYSIAGFVAAAVVSIGGQPVAQVAIDDLDISKWCKHFGTIQRTSLEVIEQGGWGEYEETIMTSGGYHILMRIVGSEKKAFLVLITGRETSPAESLEVMANVEGAISAALR